MVDVHKGGDIHPAARSILVAKEIKQMQKHRVVCGNSTDRGEEGSILSGGYRGVRISSGRVDMQARFHRCEANLLSRAGEKRGLRRTATRGR